MSPTMICANAAKCPIMRCPHRPFHSQQWDCDTFCSVGKVCEWTCIEVRGPENE